MIRHLSKMPSPSAKNYQKKKKKRGPNLKPPPRRSQTSSAKEPQTKGRAFLIEYHSFRVEQSILWYVLPAAETHARQLMCIPSHLGGHDVGHTVAGYKLSYLVVAIVRIFRCQNHR